jgi:hypothetical protein
MMREIIAVYSEGHKKKHLNTLRAEYGISEC